MLRAVVVGACFTAMPMVVLAASGQHSSSGALPNQSLESLRDQGYAFQKRQDCLHAYPMFLAASKRSGGAAEDMLAAAECAIQLKRKAEAISELRTALARRSELSRDNQVEALTSLADLLEETPAKREAAETWDLALQLSDTAEIRLGSARSWRAAGNISRADAMLATVDPKRLTPDLQADYWTQTSEQLAKRDPQSALDAINRAIGLQDADYRRVERADLLGKLGRKQEAIADLEFAHRQNPKDKDTELALAYAYNEAGRHAEAANAFAEAARLGAPTADFLEDWAYALADAGKTEEADQKFRELIEAEEAKALASGMKPDSLEAKLFDAREKVREIEQDFRFTATLNYRSDSVSIPLLEPRLENGIGAEASWRTPVGLLSPRDVSIFASAFASFQNGLSVNGDSTQGALGLRWLALKDPEISVSFERYIKIGSSSRNGWAASANFSAEQGTDWNPSASHWHYLTADASLDYLWEEPHSFSAVAEARGGEAFALGGHTMFIPFGLLAGQTVDETTTHGSLVEAGVGLGLRHWLTNDTYRGLGDVLEVSVQYRLPLVRDSLGRNGGAFVLQATLEH